MNAKLIGLIAAALLSQSAMAVSQPQSSYETRTPAGNAPAPRTPDRMEDAIQLQRVVAGISGTMRVAASPTDEELSCLGWGECKAPRAHG